MDTNARPIDANILVEILTAQRNALFSENAKIAALLAMADARIAQLEQEVARLRDEAPSKETLQ